MWLVIMKMSLHSFTTRGCFFLLSEFDHTRRLLISTKDTNSINFSPFPLIFWSFDTLKCNIRRIFTVDYELICIDVSVSWTLLSSLSQRSPANPCFEPLVYIWLYRSAAKDSPLDDWVMSLTNLPTGTRSHLLGGILASLCHPWPLMADICIDRAQPSGSHPSGHGARVTVIDLQGLDLAAPEKILVINSPTHVWLNNISQFLSVQL